MELTRYRSDIDGLRAVAVLSVVMFHLFKTSLPGGYLGVDMFFVLSGYLITAIIWTELHENRFSIVRFYDRRIRRIMPALLVVLAATTAASLLLLLPSDLIGYAKSLLATLVFGANVYFWRDTDYFSAGAEQKPLLHIWSLGVEEQFYILFPLILMLLVRWRPRRAIHAIGALTLGSLGANAFALYVGGSLPAFFLLPTRAWELGLGAMLALMPASATPRAGSATVTGVIGALLVVGGILHPIDLYWMAPVALPVVAGTALLVIAGRHNASPINRLLRQPPLVFVGLISYSLYLWHWPVIVLSQYYLVRALTAPQIALALASMLLLAACSWRYIERPFRDKQMPIRTVRLTAAAGALILAGAAAAILSADGLPGRLSTGAAAINQAVDTNYRCAVSDYLALGRSRACVMNLPSRKPADAQVVLLGNSHAQMYAPLWTAIITQQGLHGLLVPANGCLPTVQANISVECLAVARDNLAEVLQLRRVQSVIVGLNWDHRRSGLLDSGGHPLKNPADRALILAVDDLIDRLRADGKRVVLIGPIAEPGWNVASILSRQLAFGRPTDQPDFLPETEFERQFGEAIAHFSERTDIGFARPDRVQCSAERCRFVLDGRSLFSDSNHLAQAELPRFREEFAAALSAAPPAAVTRATGR